MTKQILVQIIIFLLHVSSTELYINILKFTRLPSTLTAATFQGGVGADPKPPAAPLQLQTAGEGGTKAQALAPPLPLAVP